jgi:hypothetical protein
MALIQAAFDEDILAVGLQEIFRARDSARRAAESQFHTGER